MFGNVQAWLMLFKDLCKFTPSIKSINAVYCMYCRHILLNRPLSDSNLIVFNSLLQQARMSYNRSTCTHVQVSCAQVCIWCHTARLQYLHIDIDLNLLYQYPQTQPVASKDKANNLIRKPDTQKKPNLTPRETESPN